MKKFALALLFITSSSVAVATGDPVAGQSTAIICIGCHGADGNGSNGIYPKLAGQGEAYLIKQLTDFKSGARKEQHMTSMVEAIEMSDIPNLAAYFSHQKRKGEVTDKTKAELGKKIYLGGIADKGVAACAGCHGPDGAGNPAAKFPRLSSQYSTYVSKMLMDFRSGTRSNDPQKMMRNVVSKMSDKEIESVAAYVAGLN